MNTTYDPATVGTIFNVQRFSVHDGPGIRTVVFLKGCSLRCIWCSNPESLSCSIQIGVYPDRCIGTDKCSACIHAAPDANAFVVENHRVTALDARRPQDYERCAEVCPTSALKVWGRQVTVGEVMQEVMADEACYRESGGGLTLSGGEALLQGRFATDLLKAARSAGISTCVETALNYDAKVIDELMPVVDFFYCDLKHMDPDLHRKFTGASNARILSNLRKIVAADGAVVIRIPVVPGYNGTEANLRATARFVAEELKGRVIQVQLLPFRKLGEDKYASLGLAYTMQDFTAPARAVWERDLLRHAEMMSGYGLNVVAGAASCALR